jgi:hypothetical protein
MYRNRLEQIFFKAALNIGDRMISQFVAEEVMDDIELLDMLELIEEKIQEEKTVYCNQHWCGDQLNDH